MGAQTEARSRTSDTAANLANDPRYQQLIRRRGRFSWLLSIIMLVIYFGYILLIAFRRDILARPISEGVTTVGIPAGIAVILSGIALAGIYVFRMNRTFDPEMRALLREFGPRFAFLTCAPNDLARPIHAKAMPVILHEEQYKPWLDGEPVEQFQTCFPTQLMKQAT